MRTKLFAGVGIATLVATSGFAGYQLDKIIKGVGGAALIQKFGPQINSGINKMAGHTDTDSAATKVVPIISVGKSAAIGACQVMGARRNVSVVKAVAQLEGDVFGSVRVKALIPIASDKANGGKLERVQGVGISGLVDVRL